MLIVLSRSHDKTVYVVTSRMPVSRYHFGQEPVGEGRGYDYPKKVSRGEALPWGLDCLIPFNMLIFIEMAPENYTDLYLKNKSKNRLKQQISPYPFARSSCFRSWERKKAPFSGGASTHCPLQGVVPISPGDEKCRILQNVATRISFIADTNRLLDHRLAVH